MNRVARNGSKTFTRTFTSDKGTLKNPDERRRHILLTDVPRSVTTADLRRVVTRAKLQGVSDAAIEYKHFRPTGRVILSLTHSDHLWKNIRALEHASISGIPIQAFPSRPPAMDPTMSRTRGLKGRQEAADRGYVTGNGPHGGITNSQKNVVVAGFPGKMSLDTAKEVFGAYTVKGADKGLPSVTQVPLPGAEFSLASRFLVQMDSVSEAYRLVRDIHQTFYRPDLYGARFPLQAHVVQ